MTVQFTLEVLGGLQAVGASPGSRRMSVHEEVWKENAQQHLQRHTTTLEGSDRLHSPAPPPPSLGNGGCERSQIIPELPLFCLFRFGIKFIVHVIVGFINTQAGQAALCTPAGRRSYKCVGPCLGTQGDISGQRA
jgi:hypothetical protein